MGEPPDQPPAMPDRQRPLHRLKYVVLIFIFLSGPVMFSIATAKSFATKDVNRCQETTRDTPRDWAAKRLPLTFDQNESDAGYGWVRVIGDRDALELAAFTVDKQKIRLHSASWPVQPKAGAQLHFWSPNEVANFVEWFRNEADRDEESTNKLSRDLYGAQWIARNSARHWDHPDGTDTLDALLRKSDEAAARQLAIWRVLDGLDPKSYYYRVPEEIGRRAQELVEFADHYAQKNRELELATATVGASSARKDGQVLVKADITLTGGGKVPNQPLTFDYPGGRVLARTNEHGEVCMSLPETIGETPPTVVVRWERYVPAGSYFVGRLNSGVAAKGAEEHMDRTHALAGRPFVAITLNGFRAIDQLTLPMPPNE